MIDQAERVISKFGSTYKLAMLMSEFLGRQIHRSTVSRWRKPRDEGGCDGYVPQRWHVLLLQIAERRGIDLQPLDFLVEVDRD